MPDRRGRRVGTAVVGQLLTTARALGVDLVEINVDEGDVDAQRFYERHGFSPTQEGSTERAFYYALELASARPGG